MHHNISLPGGSRQVFIGGWHRQPKDRRDETFRIKSHRFALGSSATKCDNRPICSPVEDQADLGSCTANAFAALVEANEIRSGAKAAMHLARKTPQVSVTSQAVRPDGSVTFQTLVKVVEPAPLPTPSPANRKFVDISRLFHYYVTRQLMGTVNEDSGATIRDTIKAGNKYGMVDEKYWPYKPLAFRNLPPQNVWTEAAKHKVTSYHAIADGDLETIKATLLTGQLVEFGFEVFDFMVSDEMGRTGVLPLPVVGEASRGGHAVALAGFDDDFALPDGSKGAFLVRNSWGLKWGQSGYFWMAYSYVGNPKLASDFWVVQSSPV